MKNKRSLVTGAAGFLGSHLIDQLIQLEHEVIAIDILPLEDWVNLSQWKDSSQLKCIQQDITKLDQESSDFNEIDYVFHLAGIECAIDSYNNPEHYFQTNVIGTVKVLEACKRAFVKKVIFASSFEVYGNSSTPTLETDELNPLSPSALSKKLAEESLFHWAKSFNFEATALRIFNAFGPRCKSASSFGNGFEAWMKQTLEKLPLTFRGEKEQLVDFIYCTDVANAFVTAALLEGSAEVYNIGSGKPHSLQDIATLLKSNHTREANSNLPPQRIWADISKFQFDSNWQPRVPLSSGIEFSLKQIDQWKGSKTWDQKELEKFLALHNKRT